MRFLLAMIMLVVSVSAQTWQSGPALPTGGAARAYAAGVAIGNTIYALGGTPFVGGADGSAHQILVGANAWTTPALTEGAYFHIGAAVDSLGRILVIGGEDAAGNAGESYLWTPLDGNDGGIEDRSNGAPAKLFALTTDDNGNLHVFGGGAGANPSASHPNVGLSERYDAVQDSWTVLAPMPTPVADAAACNDGQGHLLVLGGFDASGQRTANVASFDLASGSWSDTAVPDLPAARSGLRAVRGADDRIYAIGGSDATGATATTFVFDQSLGTWSMGPSLAVAREHFACVLGADDQIWAIGGANGAQGTNTVELLLTPRCPVITAFTSEAHGYVGTAFSVEVTVSGGIPLVFQWWKDGVPLADGIAASGATITGANGARLSATGISAADEGSYVCQISNGCGSTQSASIPVVVLPAPAVPVTFGTYLLPSSSGATAWSVDGGLIVGTQDYVHPTYGTLTRPVVWTSPAGAPVDLTPANSVGGAVRHVRDGTLVGWWWWPYTTTAGTGYNRNACSWSAPSAGAHHQLQISGWEYGLCYATNGAQSVGGLTLNDMSTNGHGHLWTMQSPSGPNLTPSPAWGSSATAIDGSRQFGSVHHGFGVVHAAGWSGSGASHQDMNPAGSTWSFINGAGSGQQVGRATFGGVNHPGVWSGSADSFVSLLPLGATSGSALACEGGYQVGEVGNHAALWTGSANSFIDLHQMLPTGFSASSAKDIDVDQNGVISIAGTGYNSQSGQFIALLWRGVPSSLTQNRTELSLTAGGTVRFALYAGPQYAGAPYYLLGSLSGTTPGIPVSATQTVPLNIDSYFLQLLNSPNTLIVPSASTLDGAGFAVAEAVIPPFLASPPGLPLTVHHGFVAISGPQLFVSDAVALTILP